MINQDSAKRRIVRDRNYLPFYWKVMISRSCDQTRFAFAASAISATVPSSTAATGFSVTQVSGINDRVPLSNELVHLAR